MQREMADGILTGTHGSVWKFLVALGDRMEEQGVGSQEAQGLHPALPIFIHPWGVSFSLSQVWSCLSDWIRFNF